MLSIVVNLPSVKDRWGGATEEILLRSRVRGLELNEWLGLAFKIRMGRIGDNQLFQVHSTGGRSRPRLSDLVLHHTLAF